jgi:hypothetical protein
MKAINEAAARHFALGVLKEQDVPVGMHALGGVQIVITCPDGAAVNRPEGDLGEGLDSCEPSIPLAAALLFIERQGLSSADGVRAVDEWKQCIIDTAQKKVRPATPAAAMAALKELAKEMQPGCRVSKRTSAERICVAGAVVTVQRIKSRKPRRRAA